MSSDHESSMSQALVANTTRDAGPDVSTTNASGELTLESKMKRNARTALEGALQRADSLYFEGSDTFSYNLSRVVTKMTKDLSQAVQEQFDNVFADSGLFRLERESMNGDGEIKWFVRHEVRKEICHHEKVLRKTMLDCRTLIRGKLGPASSSIPLKKVSIHTSIPAPRQTFEEATKSQVRYSIEEAKMLEDEEARNALIQQVENGLMQLESKVNERFSGTMKSYGSNDFVKLAPKVRFQSSFSMRANKVDQFFPTHITGC